MKLAAFLLMTALGLSNALAQVAVPAAPQRPPGPTVIPTRDAENMLLVASDFAKPMAPASLKPLSGVPCIIGNGYFKIPIGFGDARQALSVVSRNPSEMLSGAYVAPDIVNVPYVYTSEEQLVRFLHHLKKDEEPYTEMLRAPAIKAFMAMSDAAGHDGLVIKVHSGYRAFDTQCGTFRYKYNNTMAANPQRRRGNAEDEIATARDVNTRSAFPGTSEHQLGTALDIVTYISAPGADGKPMGYKLEPEMDQTPAYAWLQANAYKFGFVLSYPKGPDGATSVNPRTGYIYEPWHWRYIGPVPARRYNDCLRKNGMTTQEFLRALNKNTAFTC